MMMKIHISLFCTLNCPQVQRMSRTIGPLLVAACANRKPKRWMNSRLKNCMNLQGPRINSVIVQCWLETSMIQCFNIPLCSKLLPLHLRLEALFKTYKYLPIFLLCFIHIPYRSTQMHCNKRSKLSRAMHLCSPHLPVQYSQLLRFQKVYSSLSGA